ncbi:hypothetical protein FACS1894132_12090 [Clostridia bacterium]|nr:hypothetical protein FACS1894132_12090 [Clostridia bacterium]
MISQVAKWGNSQGLRIDKNLLDSIGLNIGDNIEIIKQNDMLILKPQKSRTINWFLEDYERSDDGWENVSEPKGREEW